MNRRLCRLSSTKEDFLAVVEPYQEALDRAGYNHQLLYQEPDPPAAPTGRTRTRKVTWFNPPFSQSISTNVAQKFLHLIDTCFPPEHFHNLVSHCYSQNTRIATETPKMPPKRQKWPKTPKISEMQKVQILKCDPYSSPLMITDPKICEKPKKTPWNA